MWILKPFLWVGQGLVAVIRGLMLLVLKTVVTLGIVGLFLMGLALWITHGNLQ